MKLPRRNFLHLAAGAAALPAVSRIAWAQPYPTRPVRLIAPVAPAGASDITARLMGQWLSERLGQSFIIENRPGGGNNIDTEAVVRAPADGNMSRPAERVADNRVHLIAPLHFAAHRGATADGTSRASVRRSMS